MAGSKKREKRGLRGDDNVVSRSRETFAPQMPTYSHNSGDSEPLRLTVSRFGDDVARLGDTANGKDQRLPLRSSSAWYHTMLVVLA